MDITLRLETEFDHRRVEEVTREAFWNLHVPGCDEHYLVHIMRKHPDFIPDLDFVAVYENHVIGNIMYAASVLEDESGGRLGIVTFGPVSVLPEYQRRGVGTALIRHSVEAAFGKGFKAVVIHGHPGNYCRHGFRSGKDLHVSTPDGRFPYSLLVLESDPGVLAGHSWEYRESGVYTFDPAAAFEFDALFEEKQKAWTVTQEEFSIASRAYLE